MSSGRPGETASDAALARAVALEAAALLCALQRPGACRDDELGQRGDREANAAIVTRLSAARPDDAILSEEAVDDPVRLTARRVWIVDPLDGTREFRERRDDYAVHIALAIDGIASVGAVALPALGRVFVTDDPVSPPVDSRGAPRMVVSRSRATPLVARVAALIDAISLPMGSAGAKAMAVVDGRADIYLHEGGQFEWDNCAPVAVAVAAGFHASRIDGSPLVYNRADPRLPDLLICRPDRADQLLKAIADAR